MKDKIAILHLDSELGWRGGQQQAVYLFEYLLKNNYKTHFICRIESKLAGYFKQNDYPFHSLPLKNEFDLYSAWKIAQFCQKNHYQILHLHSAHALALGLLAKVFNRELKLIGVRRVDFRIKKNIFSQFKYKTKLLDKLVAISDNIKQVLLEDGISQEKIQTIRSGIDIDKFDNIRKDHFFRNELSTSKDSIIIGTVAALVGHKDYPNLLKAAELVIQKYEKVIFVAAGSGNEEKEIKRLAGELNLKNRFKFLGYRNDIGLILKSLDIFVLASKLEGLGTSVLDAMSVGLPIVGTNAGGIPEMIENGKNGIIVPKQNPQALANAIEKLILNKTLRNKLAENAKSEVEKFALAHNAEENIKLYQELL